VVLSVQFNANHMPQTLMACWGQTCRTNEVSVLHRDRELASLLKQHTRGAMWPQNNKKGNEENSQNISMTKKRIKIKKRVFNRVFNVENS